MQYVPKPYQVGKYMSTPMNLAIVHPKYGQSEQTYAHSDTSTTVTEFTHIINMSTGHNSKVFINFAQSRHIETYYSPNALQGHICLDFEI